MLDAGPLDRFGPVPIQESTASPCPCGPQFVQELAKATAGIWIVRILSAINTTISLVLIALLFGAIYKVLPDRSLSRRDVGFGAIVTAVLFTVGKSLIGWYLGTSAVASSYGAAGSLIVLLLWVFCSSAIFLLGAEITRAYATSLGTREDLVDEVSEPSEASPTLVGPEPCEARHVLCGK